MNLQYFIFMKIYPNILLHSRLLLIDFLKNKPKTFFTLLDRLKSQPKKPMGNEATCNKFCDHKDEDNHEVLSEIKMNEYPLECELCYR